MSEHPATGVLPGAPPQVPSAMQASEVIGEWYWAIPDRLVATHGVAALYRLDPERAAQGLPTSDFLAAVHPEDRDWLAARKRDHSRKGGICVAE